MAEIWMDVDTALSEVPVNVMPLIDDTDFKTIEDAVAYNAAGMALFWHFVTTAGAYTVTAVTPTTAGDYDWTDQGTAGIYTIEIPASGGASINNDTEGFGWFSGVCDGVLPWRGPVIGFRAAAINDALIDSAWSATRGLAGTALPNAAADAAGGLVISDAGGLDIDAKLSVATSALATPTNITAATGVTLTATTGLGNQTANITGTLSGTVGGIAGTITTLDALDTAQDTQHTTTQTYLSTNVGLLGANLTAADDAVIAALATAQIDLDTLTGSDGATLATAQPNAVLFSAGMTISSTTGDALALTSLGGNGVGLVATGNGGGAGIRGEGGATGPGILGMGGLTSGAGIRGTGQNNSQGIVGLGEGTGAGIQGSGGVDGPGMWAYGGATSGDGITATGNGTGVDIRGDITGNVTGTITTTTNLTNLPSGVQTSITNIEADTNELQTDWANGGRLDVLLDICYDAASQLLGVGGYVDEEIRSMLGMGVADLDTNELQTNQGAWATATGFSTHSAADVLTALGTGTWATSLATQVSVDDLPTNAELATALGTADDAVLAAIAALQDLSSSEAFTAVLTTQLTESYAADGAAPTLAQAIFLIQQALTEFAISGTTTTIKKIDGSTTAATLTLDDGTTPTSVTRAT
jgi:hypothetical protein